MALAAKMGRQLPFLREEQSRNGAIEFVLFTAPRDNRWEHGYSVLRSDAMKTAGAVPGGFSLDKRQALHGRIRS